jgi:hypothetical protein
MSTQGRNQPIYSGDIEAKHNQTPRFDETIDYVLGEAPLGLVTAMDPVLNRALWSIPEAGIWADVYLLRAEDTVQQTLRDAETRIEHLEAFVLQERRSVYEARDRSRRRCTEASQRLLDACATAKILDLTKNLECH